MENRYKNQKLRNRLKNNILNSDKGGRPGQWSARKAQILALKYKQAGGKYRRGKVKTQRSLDKWTRQKWRTYSGKPSLQTGERYLPASAFKRLSISQIRSTNRKKKEGMKQGQQFVPNTKAARVARRLSP